MSANTAEVLTLISALREVDTQQPLLIVGDSQIALKWVNVAIGNRKATKLKGASREFRAAVAELAELFDPVQQRYVTTQWTSREHAVSIFGH